jgi:hypothetical protein
MKTFNQPQKKIVTVELKETKDVSLFQLIYEPMEVCSQIPFATEHTVLDSMDDTTAAASDTNTTLTALPYFYNKLAAYKDCFVAKSYIKIGLPANAMFGLKMTHH